MQYYKIEEEIPNEERISLLASGRPLNFEPFPFTEYTTREDEKRSQFMTLLAILSLLYNPDKQQHVIIYAGPQLKTVEYLSSLFPGMSWDVWLMPNVSKDKMIRTYRGSIDLQKDYFLPKGRGRSQIIFFSFTQNMKQNLDFYELIDADFSILPLRVSQEGTQYLRGEMLNTVFANRKSEWINLLIKKGAKMREYDLKSFTENNFNFNIDYRARSYPSLVVNKDYDHCYDCAMENSLWDLYMLKMGRIPDVAVISDYIKTLSRYL